MSDYNIKVLIITYYWPPAGGSGVQRWLKFVKYLRDFDIEPVVFTADTDHLIKDETLVKEIPEGIEVIKTPITEPQQVLSKFGVKTKNNQGNGFLESKPTLGGRIMRYVRANYFIPDARKLWIKPSVRYLEEYLKTNPVDVVITSGPPHSLHLIGLNLKSKLNLKWIADFRDPWVDVFYNETLKLSASSRRKNVKLQTATLESADCVITVSNSIKENLRATADAVHVITNGFDGNEVTSDISLDTEFSISYIGSLPEESDSELLWQCLDELFVEYKDFASDLRLRFIGNINEKTVQWLKSSTLKESVEMKGYVNHSQVLNYQKSSQILLLLIPNSASSKGIITGKLFEYVRAKRPILAIGPEDGDAAKILTDTNSGKMFNFDKKSELKEYILHLYKRFKQGNLNVDSQNIDQYHRKNLTKELAGIIKKINAQY